MPAIGKMIRRLTDRSGHIISKPRWKVFYFLPGRLARGIKPRVRPFRDKSLTGFAEKGIVFIHAVSNGAFLMGR